MKKLHALVLSALTVLTASAQTLELETVVSGLTNPVDIAHCGDSRIFIVERAGRIKVLQPNGQVLATPFLDISGPVHSGGGEQGLLGLAFHPQYAQNGFFYLYYCTGTGNGGVRVARFSVSADPNVAKLTIKGIFQTRNLDTFTRVATDIFGLKAEKKNNQIILSR